MLLPPTPPLQHVCAQAQLADGKPLKPVQDLVCALLADGPDGVQAHLDTASLACLGSASALITRSRLAAEIPGLAMGPGRRGGGGGEGGACAHAVLLKSRAWNHAR